MVNDLVKSDKRDSTDSLGWQENLRGQGRFHGLAIYCCGCFQLMRTMANNHSDQL